MAIATLEKPVVQLTFVVVADAGAEMPIAACHNDHPAVPGFAGSVVNQLLVPVYVELVAVAQV